MSVMRVFVFETSEPRAKMMKHWRDGEHVYKKAERDGILKNYRLVETSDRWMAVTEFDTKAKLNKFVKAVAEQRKTVLGDTGGQGWAYEGTVRGSN
ncbi:MAG: hypothetical protein VCE75_28685 [Alphaproteobacteria bacterium]